MSAAVSLLDAIVLDTHSKGQKYEGEEYPKHLKSLVTFYKRIKEEPEQRSTTLSDVLVNISEAMKVRNSRSGEGMNRETADKVTNGKIQLAEKKFHLQK